MDFNKEKKCQSANKYTRKMFVLQSVLASATTVLLKNGNDCCFFPVGVPTAHRIVTPSFFSSTPPTLLLAYGKSEFITLSHKGLPLVNATRKVHLLK
ncbi:hypothetical protein QE152_g23470 [Popillia japonica]|uniref:Uncharacterized protein n=1 Tax=Popillia japonica TaxID=7064 RepID=A0AAW1KGR2_POPJA